MDNSAAVAEYEERQKRIAAEEAGVLRMEREIRERARSEKEARRAAGMGFFRLVWIVAFGILLAGAIAGAIVAIVRFLS